jgi:hypothetical protein
MALISSFSESLIGTEVAVARCPDDRRPISSAKSLSSSQFNCAANSRSRFATSGTHRPSSLVAFFVLSHHANWLRGFALSSIGIFRLAGTKRAPGLVVSLSVTIKLTHYRLGRSADTLVVRVWATLATQCCCRRSEFRLLVAPWSWTGADLERRARRHAIMAAALEPHSHAVRHRRTHRQAVRSRNLCLDCII